MAWLVLAFAVCTTDARGQTLNGAAWQQGATLSGFAGAAAADTTRLAAGTALGWEVTPHLTVEGRGVWLPDDSGSTDFFAWLGALVPFRPATSLVPFASAGVGMYRSTVTASSTDVPSFYRDRLAAGASRAIFEDVLLTAGGGADVFVSSHFAVRPEVSLLVVTTRSDRRAAVMYGVHLAYHFEPHRTP
jgi:hypothetical protein